MKMFEPISSVFQANQAQGKSSGMSCFDQCDRELTLESDITLPSDILCFFCISQKWFYLDVYGISACNIYTFVESDCNVQL